ncbi:MULTISPECIES: hypothetical protein [unclassified Acinetobacter]|uniref:hypothetical protein n=1 Tax=unclassified Acinetobacter TaxID=196816 RepID=UPI0020B3CCFA|nr:MULTISPECIES: hypothetical protein [unclassified Acinetobacter]
MAASVSAEQGRAATPAAKEVQPITQAEIQQGLLNMQQRLDARIEKWGQSLDADDFEWTWRGRKLKQAKRQEVCEIFQGVVDEMYQLAVKNKARLNSEDQKLLSNRSLFIEKLGYENNRVNTRMGFDCHLR